MNINEQILTSLNQIEQDYDCKILFAVESGSRAWGFESTDSDYDVRFVYIKRPEWYLSIDDKRDVIELPITDEIDINGWDLRKALKLFRKSNPPLLEWLTSHIVYMDNYGARGELSDLKPAMFSTRSLIHHYLSMAKSNFREYLQADMVRVKKYFYVLRPILACEWILQNHSTPPIIFNDMLHLVQDHPTVWQEIQALLVRKRSGVELGLEPRNDILNDYIIQKLEAISASTAWLPGIPQNNSTTMLNCLFMDFLNKVWLDATIDKKP